LNAACDVHGDQVIATPFVKFDDAGAHTPTASR
jgi:hypothetical protein